MPRRGLPNKINLTNNYLQVLNLLRIESNVNTVEDILNILFLEAKKLNYDLFCLQNFYDLDKYKSLNLSTDNVEINYYTYNYQCGIINKYESELVLP